MFQSALDMAQFSRSASVLVRQNLLFIVVQQLLLLISFNIIIVQFS